MPQDAAPQIPQSPSPYDAIIGAASPSLDEEPSPTPKAGPYDEIINRHAARTGVDPDLIRSVMGQESTDKPYAVSPKGARGLMQLMPHTAARYGVNNIYDPNENIGAGANYLKFLNDRYKGDPDKVLAAYNAGEGNVDKYGGIPPFKETRNYVPAVKSRYEKLTGRKLTNPSGNGANGDPYDSIVAGASNTSAEPESSPYDAIIGSVTPPEPQEPGDKVVVQTPQGPVRVKAATAAALGETPIQRPSTPATRGLPQQGTMPGAVHLDPAIAPKVPAGAPRPLAPGEWVDNPDGSWSSEISSTIQNPDKSWSVVPGMWLVNGKPQRVDEDTAAKYAQASGLNFPKYKTLDEAEKFATDRESVWQGVKPQEASKIAPLWSSTPTAGATLSPRQQAQAAMGVQPGTPPVTDALMRTNENGPSVSPDTPQPVVPEPTPATSGPITPDRAPATSMTDPFYGLEKPGVTEGVAAAVERENARRQVVNSVYGPGTYEQSENLVPADRERLVQNAQNQAQQGAGQHGELASPEDLAAIGREQQKYSQIDTVANAAYQELGRRNALEAARQRAVAKRRAEAQAVMQRQAAQTPFADVQASAGGAGTAATKVLPQVGGPPTMSGITSASTARIAEQPMRRQQAAREAEYNQLFVPAQQQKAQAIIAQESMRQGPGLPTIGDRVSDRLQAEGALQRPLSDDEKRSVSALGAAAQVSQTDPGGDIYNQARATVLNRNGGQDNIDRIKRDYSLTGRDPSEVDKRISDQIQAEAHRQQMSQLSPEDQKQIADMTKSFASDSKLYRWLDVGGEGFAETIPAMAAGTVQALGDVLNSDRVREAATVMRKELNKRAVAANAAQADMSTPEKAATYGFDVLGNVIQIGALSAIVGPQAAMSSMGGLGELGRSGSYGRAAVAGGKGFAYGTGFKYLPELEPYPQAKVLSEKLANLGTDIAAVGSGTYGLELATGTPEPEARKAALTNAAAVGLMRVTQIIPNLRPYITEPLAREIVRSPYAPETARNIANKVAGTAGFRQPAVVTEYDTPAGSDEALVKYGEQPVVPKRALSFYRNPDTGEYVAHEIDLETAKKYHEAAPDRSDLVTVNGRPYTSTQGAQAPNAESLTTADATYLRNEGENPNEWARVYDPDGRPVLVRQADVIMPRHSFRATPEEFEKLLDMAGKGKNAPQAPEAKLLEAPAPQLAETNAPRVMERGVEEVNAPERAQAAREAAERPIPEVQAENVSLQEKESALRALTGASNAGDTDSVHHLTELAKQRGATADEIAKAAIARPEPRMITPVLEDLHRANQAADTEQVKALTKEARAAGASPEQIAAATGGVVAPTSTTEGARLIERPETVERHLDALVAGRGNRTAVILSPGQPEPSSLQSRLDQGMEVRYPETAPEGTLVVYDPNRVTGEAIDKAFENNTTHKLIGKPNAESPKATLAAATYDKSGLELDAAYLEPGNEKAYMDEMRAQHGPDVTFSIGGKPVEAAVLNQRLAASPVPTQFEHGQERRIGERRADIQYAQDMAKSVGAKVIDNPDGTVRIQFSKTTSGVYPNLRSAIEEVRRRAGATSVPEVKPLTEDKFYDSYYQHKVLRAGADLEKLKSEGWKGGIGPQALPAMRGEVDNAMQRKYGVKAGDTVLLVPREAIKQTPNGSKIKEGWKPKDSEIVTADRDNQPAYELYQKGLAALSPADAAEPKIEQTPAQKAKSAQFDADARELLKQEPNLGGEFAARTELLRRRAKESEKAPSTKQPATVAKGAQPKNVETAAVTPIAEAKTPAAGAGQPAPDLIKPWKDARVGSIVEHDGKYVEVAGRHLRRTKADEVAAKSGATVIPEPQAKSGLAKRFAVVKATEYAEPERETEFKYASTQVNLPPKIAKLVKVLSMKIADADLAEDGREGTPHITLKWGLHGEEPDEVEQVLEGERPITAKLKRVSIFPASESGKADVVKIDVTSRTLHRLNKKISDEVEVTDTHPSYKPHITLAYTKPGRGSKYVGMDMGELADKEITFDEVAFSDKDGEQVAIPLEGGEEHAVDQQQQQKGGEPKHPRVAQGTPVREDSGEVRAKESAGPGGSDRVESGQETVGEPRLSEEELAKEKSDVRQQPISGSAKRDHAEAPEEITTKEKEAQPKVVAAAQPESETKVEHAVPGVGGRDLADAFDDLLEQPAAKPAGTPQPVAEGAATTPRATTTSPTSISEKTLSLGEFSDRVKTVSSKTSVADLQSLVEQGQRIRETVKTNAVLNSTLGLLEKMLKKKGGKVAPVSTIVEKPAAPAEAKSEPVKPKSKIGGATVPRVKAKPVVETPAVEEVPAAVAVEPAEPIDPLAGVVADIASLYGAPAPTVAEQPVAEIETPAPGFTSTDNWKGVGVNKSGDAILENDQGVRSYVVEGHRFEEPKTADGKPATPRGKEFQTVDAEKVKPRPEVAAPGEKGRYRYDIQGASTADIHWTSNAKRYDTPQEADDAANELLSRWYGAKEYRVVAADHPEREVITDEQLKGNASTEALKAAPPKVVEQTSIVKPKAGTAVITSFDQDFYVQTDKGGLDEDGTPEGRSLHFPTQEEAEAFAAQHGYQTVRESDLQDWVANKIKAAPSYPALRKAYVSHLKSTYGRLDEYDNASIRRSDKEPWNLLTAHSGVMNAKSARAQTLERLANAVFAETKLPRRPMGKYRGENGVDWDKVKTQYLARKPEAEPTAITSGTSSDWARSMGIDVIHTDLSEAQPSPTEEPDELNLVSSTPQLKTYKDPEGRTWEARRVGAHNKFDIFMDGVEQPQGAKNPKSIEGVINLLREKLALAAEPTEPVHITTLKELEENGPSELNPPTKRRSATEPRVKKERVAEAPAKAHITDVGQNLWYNRRNFTGKALAWDTVKDLNDTLKVKEVVKSKVWPRPNYEQLIADGLNPLLARLAKKTYDGVANEPRKKDDESLQRYISVVDKIRSNLFDWLKELNEDEAFRKELDTAIAGEHLHLNPILEKTKYGLFYKIWPEAKGTGSTLYRIEGETAEDLRAAAGTKGRGRRQYWSIDADLAIFENRDIIGALNDLKEGWPTPQEAWQRQGWKILNGDDAKTELYGGSKYVGPNHDKRIEVTHVYLKIDGHIVSESTVDVAAQADPQVVDAVAKLKALVAGKFVLARKYGRSEGLYDTEEEAKAAAREKTKRHVKEGEGGRDLRGMNIAQSERVGPDRRADEDITPERLMKEFGFRGVNFGRESYINQAERQAYLNAAFDGLVDLAEIMGVPRTALSLEGMMGLAFGAQGRGGTVAAHFVPGVNEINLTKTAGAGTLAHEMGHALDHYFARLAGLGSEAQPFVTENLSKATSAGNTVRVEKVDPNTIDDADIRLEPFKNDNGGTDSRVFYKDRLVGTVGGPADSPTTRGLAKNRVARDIAKVIEPSVRKEVIAAFRAISEAMNKRVLTPAESKANLAKRIDGQRSGLKSWIDHFRRDLAPKAGGATPSFKQAQALKDFDELATRLLDGDMGSGYVTIRGKGFPQVVAQMRMLVRENGKDSGARDWGSLESWARHLRSMLSMKDADEEHVPQETEKSVYAKESAKRDKDKGGKDYWDTEREKFARAWESFIADKLDEAGQKNTFLSDAALRAEHKHASGEYASPYPRGEERKVMNAAFQTLIDTIQTKETEKGTALYQRALRGGPAETEYDLLNEQLEQQIELLKDFKDAKAENYLTPEEKALAAIVELQKARKDFDIAWKRSFERGFGRGGGFTWMNSKREFSRERLRDERDAVEHRTLNQLETLRRGGVDLPNVITPSVGMHGYSITSANLDKLLDWALTVPIDSENDKTIRAFENMKAISQAMYARGTPVETSDGKEARFSADGNRITLHNRAAQEVLNDAVQKIDPGAFVKSAQLPTSHARKVVRHLKDDGSPAALHLADAISAKLADGVNPVPVESPEVQRHEDFHTKSRELSNNAPLDERLTAEGFKDYTEDDAFDTAATKLKSVGYKDDLPTLADEVAAYLADGEYAKLGLKSEDSERLLGKWFTGFADKNGYETLNQFKELSDEGNRARASVLAGREDTGRGLQEPSGVRAESSSYARNILDTGPPPGGWKLSDKVPRLKTGTWVHTPEGVPGTIVKGKSSDEGPVYTLAGSPKVTGKDWKQDELTKFDEARYAQGKALFQSAMKLVPGGTPIEQMNGLVGQLRTKFALPDATIKAMKPDVLRFMDELATAVPEVEPYEEQEPASASIPIAGIEALATAVEQRLKETIHELLPNQRAMYNAAAQAMQTILQDIGQAIEVTDASPMAKMAAMRRFWSDHQRLFRQLITAFKVPTVIREVERALKEGKSVIIDLASTGESRTKEQVTKALSEGADLEDLDFSPREVIANMVDKAFPVNVYQEVEDEATGKVTKQLVRDADGNPVVSQEALRLKNELLDKLSDVQLPENPLDQIVNHFGEKNVAEITGRKRRLIRGPDGKVGYKKRAPDGIAMTRVNVHETEQFQNGAKRIAIISPAGGTGISLHASNRAKNKQRRVHVTVEFGWSADAQMQKYGRSHRSDQAFPPEYNLISTDIGGEKRFSSTIARRLASLGALTKGQRDATGGGDLAKYNFETEEGKAALTATYGNIMRDKSVEGLDQPKQALRDMGVLKEREGGESISDDDMSNVPHFLNRILALDLDRQNPMFDYFAHTFDQVIDYSKQNGTFDEGVADVKGESIRLKGEPQVVHKDKTTGAETAHYALDVDTKTTPVSFERAQVIATRKNAGFYKQKRSGNIIVARQSASHTDPATGNIQYTHVVTTPLWEHDHTIRDEELETKYEPIKSKDAATWWEQKFESVPKIRTAEMHVIGGAILPLWQKLKTEEGARLKVVRVMTDDGQRVVGIQIPNSQVASVLRSIGIGRELKAPKEIFDAVLDQGDKITLADGLSLVRSKFHGDEAIEVKGANYHKHEQLREMGLLNERIDWSQKFFVPTDEATGVPILTKLLESYPALEESKAPIPDEEMYARQLPDYSDEPRTLGGMFYSQLFRAVASKMPNKASVEQVRALIANPQSGVKPDEVKWTGFDSWLDEQKGTITKDDALAYLKANNVDVKEVQRTRGGVLSGEAEQLAEDLYARGYLVHWVPEGAGSTSEIDSVEGPVFKKSLNEYTTERTKGEYSDYQDLIRAVPNVAERVMQEYELKTGNSTRTYYANTEFTGLPEPERSMALELADKGARAMTEEPKYGEYVVPGEAENYREILLTLPPKNQRDAALVQELAKLNEMASADFTEAQRERFHELTGTIGAEPSEAEKAGAGIFQGGHFDEPNTLVFAQVDDRDTTDSKKALFVNTLQSDWHQKGRKQGYWTTLTKLPEGFHVRRDVKSAMVSRGLAALSEADDGTSVDDMLDRIEQAEKLVRYVVVYPSTLAESNIHVQDVSGFAATGKTREEATQKAIAGLNQRRSLVPRPSYHIDHALPDAPFKKNWAELAMRNLLLKAVEGGYDTLAWVTGDQAADLFDLSKHVDRIFYGHTGSLEAYKDGKMVIQEAVSPEKLPDYIGKTNAQKLLDAKPDSYGNRGLDGTDMKVGGKELAGMRGFYDKIIPDYMRKLGKKWGAEVGTAELPGPGANVHMSEADARAQVESGTPVFVQRRGYLDRVYDLAGIDALQGHYHKFLEHKPTAESVHAIPITESMKKSIKEGQALFAREIGEDPDFEEIRQGGEELGRQVEGAFPVGIKNADTEKDRANLGLDPIIIEARKVIPTIDQALRDFNPDRAYELVQAINEKSRGLSGEETAQMTVYKVYLKHEYRAALNALRQAQDADDGSEQTARIRLAILDQQLMDYHEMGRRTAYEWHFTGLMRQQMMKADYSIEEVKMRARALYGDILPADLEKQLADLVKERDDAIEALRVYDEQKSLEAAEQRLKDLQEQEAREERNRKARATAKWREDQEKDKTRVRVVTKILNRDALDDEFEQMSRDLDAMLSSDFGLNPFLEPRLLSQLKKMATNRVKAGADTVEDWVLPVWERIKGKRLVQDAGATERDLRDALSGYGKTIQMSKEEIDIKLRELRALARDVSALEDIESGQRPARSGLQRDKQTQRQRESKKRINAALREYNIQVERSERSPEELQQSALDSMKSRLRNRIEDLKTYIAGGERAPKRPGVQPDPEAQSLIAERDRLQKVLDDIEGPSRKTDDEKIAMATAAVERSIADYERRIAEGDVLTQKKASDPWSRELGRLKQRQTALKAQVADARKNHATTKAEAAERSLRALKSSIDRLEKRVATGDLSTQPKAPPAVSTPAVEAAKAQRDALKKIIADLKRANKPTPIELPEDRLWTPEELDKEAEVYARKLSALTKALERRDAELTEMLRTGKYTKKKRTPLQLSQELLGMKAEIKRKEDAIDQIMRKLALKDRHRLEKMTFYTTGLRRASALSSTAVLFKLSLAAYSRIFLSIGEEIAGAPLPYLPIVGPVVKLAPSEGGFSLDAEIRHITTAFSKYVLQQQKKMLTTGKHDVDLMFGNKRVSVEPDHWFDWIGRVHAVLKTPAKLSQFERMMHKNLLWLSRRGFDPTDQTVIMLAGNRAIVDANRAILQQANLVSDANKWVLSQLMNYKGADGKGSAIAKGIAAIIKFIYPVTRVPPNFVTEALNYTPLGFLAASARLAYARIHYDVHAELAKEVPASDRFKFDRATGEWLPPGGDGADVPPRKPPTAGGAKGSDPFGELPYLADMIARGYKKSIFGSLFMLITLLGIAGILPIEFGGHYRRGKKKKKGEVPFGGIRIAGWDMPTWTHIPLAEAMQSFADVIYLWQDNQDKDKEFDETVTGTAIGFATGMASEVPFFEEPSRAFAALETEKQTTRFFADLIAGMVLPPDVPRAARTFDPEEPTSPLRKLGNLTGFIRPQPVKRKPEGGVLQRFGQEIELGIPILRKRVSPDEDKKRLDVKEKFVDQVRAGKPVTRDIDAAVLRGDLNPGDADSIVKEGRLTAFQANFEKKSIEKAMDAFEKYPAANRAQVRQLLIEKSPSLWNLAIPAQLPAMQRFKDLTGEEPKRAVPHKPYYQLLRNAEGNTSVRPRWYDQELNSPPPQ